MKVSTLPALAALAYFAGSAPAQPDPFVRPLPPAAAGTEVVGRLLRELGYTPKAISPDVYQVTVERDRWAVHVMLSLSTDGRRIWLESKFAPVEDPDRVPPQAWKRLLEANEKIGPAHFAFDKSDKRIHLYKSFENQGLSAARLKAEVEHFDLTVRKTQDYWRADHFKPVIASTDTAPLAAPPATAVAGPSMPRGDELPALPVTRPVAGTHQLVGDWTIVEIHAKGRKTPEDAITERRPSLTVRPTRDGHVGPGLNEKLMADLRIGPDRTRAVYISLNPGLATPQIDFMDDQERSEQGIYNLDGDTLTLCFAPPGEARPSEFKTDEQSRNWLIVLKRKK